MQMTVMSEGLLLNSKYIIGYFMLFLIFTKIILLLLFYLFIFSWKLFLFFSFSGMFRYVPECSGMFRVPGSIDAQMFMFFSALVWLGLDIGFK